MISHKWLNFDTYRYYNGSYNKVSVLFLIVLKNMKIASNIKHVLTGNEWIGRMIK
jgi:hypothetical protein